MNNLKSKFTKASAAAAVGLGVLFSQASVAPVKANDNLRDILDNFALNVCVIKKMESKDGQPSEAEAAANIILDEYRENRPHEYPALAAYAQENWHQFEQEVATALCADEEGPREGRRFSSSRLPFVLIMPNDYSHRYDNYYYEGYRDGYRGQHRGYDGWRERNLRRELRRERREDRIEDRRQQQQREQWIQERRRLQQQRIEQQRENERLRRELRRERLEDRQKPRRDIAPDIRDRRRDRDDGPRVRIPAIKDRTPDVDRPSRRGNDSKPRFEGRNFDRTPDQPRVRRDFNQPNFNRGGNDGPKFRQQGPGKPDRVERKERRPKP